MGGIVSRAKRPMQRRLFHPSISASSPGKGFAYSACMGPNKSSSVEKRKRATPGPYPGRSSESMRAPPSYKKKSKMGGAASFLISRWKTPPISASEFVEMHGRRKLANRHEYPENF